MKSIDHRTQINTNGVRGLWRNAPVQYLMQSMST